MMSTTRPVPGWYRDPAGDYVARYWDGEAWTARVRNDLTPHSEPVPEVPDAADGGRRPLQVWALVLGGAVLLTLGAALPWREAQVGNLSLSNHGIDGDGALAVVFAVCIVVLFLVIEQPTRRAWLVIALAGVAVAFVLHDAVDTSRAADDLARRATRGHVTAGVGIGVWVSLAGAAVVLLGGILALLAGRPRRGDRARAPAA
jgi:hypothetical protein